MINNAEKIEVFLSNLGFDCDADFVGRDASKEKLGVDYVYEVSGLTTVYFSYLPETNFSEELHELHQKIWNENKSEVFIVISDDKTYLCSSKYKPSRDDKNACKIKDFKYGINTPGFDKKKIEYLLKESIDSDYFWSFVLREIKESKKQKVDDDLLLNLIKLKGNLRTYLSAEKIYILIERCLFLKFLEDRNFRCQETLIDILQHSTGSKLIDEFKEVNRLLNGDIFNEADGDKIICEEDLNKEIIRELHSFFKMDYRNRSQFRLFPYKFDIIPVELLSNVYEAFLKHGEKSKEGIYYTPSNLAELILGDTLAPVLEANAQPTCIDFACGSGIFLVKAFEKIVRKNDCFSDFEKKKAILKNCIFGVEKDPVATRITIFSLYLKLLEGENSDKLRLAIEKDEIKFPKLHNKNILEKDTLYDELVFENEDGKHFENFDVIVGNPPWGKNLFENRDISKMKLSDDRKEVADVKQSSQFFILKAADFMNKSSIAGMVMNNSNLLTGKGKGFRNWLLKKTDIKKVYELTQCNPILFKKRTLDKMKIGADEPAAVLIFGMPGDGKDQTIKYINPTLDVLSKFLQKISIKPSEAQLIPKDILDNDLAWRVMSLGGLDDYRLINKLNAHRGGLFLKGFHGFQFSKDDAKGFKMILRDCTFMDKESVESYAMNRQKFNQIDKEGKKIRTRSVNPNKKEFLLPKLVMTRYLGRKLRINAAYDSEGYRFHESLLGLLLDEKSDYRILLSFFNSSVINYYLTMCSAQIKKGTFDMLHSGEIESVPIPIENDIPDTFKKRLIEIVERIEETGFASKVLVDEIDETVFDIYHLKDFEKQRIRDFYFVNERRCGGSELVGESDFSKYVSRFRNVFDFILKEDKFLNAEAYYSTNLGAGLKFTLVDNKSKKTQVDVSISESLRQTIRSISMETLGGEKEKALLKQDKVKLYDDESFTIIKSNNIKDWTETAAINDANEEIGLFVQSLPDK